MYTNIKEYISERIQSFNAISEERKRTLQNVAGFISKDLYGKGTVKMGKLTQLSGKLTYRITYECLIICLLRATASLVDFQTMYKESR